MMGGNIAAVIDAKSAVFENLVKELPRFPDSLTREQFYPKAYPLMYYTRVIDEKLKELFRRGAVKGTVIISKGNEATSVGMAIPFRPGQDVLGLLHRDNAAHMICGCSPYTLFCQHMANVDSPTHAREGNVHYGDAKMRRFPMISHLGNMLAPTVGGVWAARKNGEKVFGLAISGDGASSTGEFHESLNLAAVQNVPVVFLIENNKYAFSTPVANQFCCEKLSDRAVGYGIEGCTIDGTDAWDVYSTISQYLKTMAQNPKPVLLECMTLRLEGHAAYDNAEYVSAEEKEEWLKHDPLVKARKDLKEISGFSEQQILEMEQEITEEVKTVADAALTRPRPKAVLSNNCDVYCKTEHKTIEPYSAKKVKNLQAINTALDHMLSQDQGAFLCGQDVGKYGSPFKTCKGLMDKHGSDRVIDMPICESATTGFCLGASQTGSRPIMEFQFADFSTEAVTQLGLNAGTWYYRAGMNAPLVFRLPCGGGITLGAFHSGEYDGLWSRFPGLKLLYPFTPQETYEALMAAFYDSNPSVVFEHKLLYWGKAGDIDFDGDLSKVYRPRQYTQGDKVTVVALGAMIERVLTVINKYNYSASVWNPFILNPLKFEPILESVRATGRLLVVQESGETAGLADRFISLVTRECFSSLKCAPVSVSAPDTPVPFAKELESKYLPDDDRIKAVIEKMIGEAK
ncbi:thiamine pyrophosphate-dependent enzyme [Chitinispirillales bacterium ANBcel5]|uniref:alpha-ketoacid dehydrogenase subunit alpha/beta n=1 Tax=Cellulosispirillum alkaliphilum TaxID=3039283 RepID=UPI002A4EA32A|nr:thiamine pyrophosphate-dependent enzyme [Chitinispirillales bacterium ANBcel5]